MQIELSEDKLKIIVEIEKWLKTKDSQFLTLGGYAGTGKTTLVAYLRKRLLEISKEKVVFFCSFTGKATLNLAQNLEKYGAKYKGDKVSTIHSLIYSPLTNSKEEIIGWTKKDKITADLIIIDEASMVSRNIWQDLLSYHIPIIAVGDHGQLPPIDSQFNLMAEPMYTLDIIHRQAAKNPIIQLSILARQGETIAEGNYGKGVMKLLKQDPETGEIVGELLSNINDKTLVLCGYNHTRVSLNSAIRSAMGYETTFPSVGDRLICLRNNHKSQIFNGMLGTLTHIDYSNEYQYYIELAIDGENRTYRGNVSATQFGALTAQNFTDKRKDSLNLDLFDFGYALTVHKAQGSQATRVILFEERFKQMDDAMFNKWLYTAITRAEEELYIISS